MIRRVVLSPRAKRQLRALYRYIEREALADIATDYTGALLEQIERLSRFPERGTPRDDLRPGVRTIPFRRRVTIAYAVKPTTVRILGIFYGGRDTEALMREE